MDFDKLLYWESSHNYWKNYKKIEGGNCENNYFTCKENECRYRLIRLLSTSSIYKRY